MMKMWWLMFIRFVIIDGADVVDKRFPQAKIIGGRETTIEKYPFAVQLMSREDPADALSFICGGTVISTQHVMTAAHCLSESEDDGSFKEVYASNIFVRFGFTTLSTEEGRNLRQGSAIIIHPKYKSHHHDIAILMLATAVSYSSKVQPAVLAHNGLPTPDNAVVQIIGWGVTSATNDHLSEVLREASVRTVNMNECRSRYKKDSENWLSLFESPVFCAGLLDIGGKDTCQGDSGGSVILEGVVIGVTFNGKGCADPKFPGIYTEVSGYSNWIYDVVLATTSNGAHRCRSSFLAFIVIYTHFRNFFAH